MKLLPKEAYRPQGPHSELQPDFDGCHSRDPCAYCSGRGTSWDHIEPESLGFTKTNNRIRACESCNTAKRDMSLLMFLALRARQRWCVPAAYSCAAPGVRFPCQLCGRTIWWTQNRFLRHSKKRQHDCLLDRFGL